MGHVTLRNGAHLTVQGSSSNSKKITVDNGYGASGRRLFYVGYFSWQDGTVTDTAMKSFKNLQNGVEIEEGSDQWKDIETSSEHISSTLILKNLKLDTISIQPSILHSDKGTKGYDQYYCANKTKCMLQVYILFFVFQD